MKRLLLSLLVLICCNPAPAATPKLTEVARGLAVPWSIAFAPDGRILFTERPGRLRVIEHGKLVATPLHVFPEVVSKSEIGLMGLVLHPDFAHNHLLYLSYGTLEHGDLVVDVTRYRENGKDLVEPKQIVQHIPATNLHAGCRLAFGPDGKLYITTGDATQRKLAQKLDSLAGKILRVNDDGSVPRDNPWPGSPIWAFGNRNPQGLAWDPKSGLLFETEHGPSGFDGGIGGDEVNIIERARNYGWPVIMHMEPHQGMETPIAEYTPACAPASAAFWRGDFYFGCLRGENLHHIVLDATNRRKIVRQESLFTNLGRIREVVAGPDGALYFSTSNRDGRGDPASTDDRIFRLAP